MKMLIVDDSSVMRNIMKMSLDSISQMEFYEARDGVDALKVIASTPGGFDLITVDWNMPEMDGITLVRKIRETDKRTLLLMVTTEAERPRVVEALKAGVNNYAVKPFKPETITEKVLQMLEKAKMAA